MPVQNSLAQTVPISQLGRTDLEAPGSMHAKGTSVLMQCKEGGKGVLAAEAVIACKFPQQLIHEKILFSSTVTHLIRPNAAAWQIIRVNAVAWQIILVNTVCHRQQRGRLVAMSALHPCVSNS